MIWHWHSIEKQVTQARKKSGLLYLIKNDTGGFEGVASEDPNAG